MKIRDANQEDLDVIINLHKKSIVPIWKKCNRDYSLDKIREFISENTGKDKVIVVEIENKIVATCKARIFDDNSSDNIICYCG